MKLNEIIRNIESVFSMPLAEEYDNVGLLYGNLERNISGILVSHDALENVVDEAIEKNCNLIVCFHPIIFSGLKSITGKNYVEKTVLKAVENKIAIYAIHTAFDNDNLGVNFGICEKLGLMNQQILMPKENHLLQLTVYVPQENAIELKNKLFEAGAGNIGNYDECSFEISGEGTFRPLENAQPYAGSLNVRENAKEAQISVIFEKFKLNKILSAMKSAHPYEEVAYQIHSLLNENQHAGLGRFGDLENEMEEREFLAFVRDQFNLIIIRHSNFSNKKIKRVGVLGGSGASGIFAAKRANCDVYLTGDLKYHDFFQAENNILLCDIGHFESEQFVVQQIFDILSEKLPKFAISKSVEKTNPVNYFI
ncbi:Nif3-like dinuclear metal center hexameric protein [Frigoriflavimonas asaccharolytica]|uniref:GTP cyclohydrolase 1 type 2 homolog n=1 Tax=Frigoriflavimonas asaccharolytica TaxID=2735899 RepID=A0A8J8G5C3_9FLAO|nr:Nif3-like dinuclear metal center hexameric protein [Frigoriflavimonas asaccharolytica]NRS91433.1 dinuclear metal center YbgI/SA1388 family protein [Frigoriflavimonas asaccharolytica]